MKIYFQSFKIILNALKQPFIQKGVKGRFVNFCEQKKIKANNCKQKNLEGISFTCNFAA